MVFLTNNKRYESAKMVRMSNKLRPGAGHVWTYGFRVEEKTRTIRAWVLPLPRGTTRYSTISRTSLCDLDMGD